MALRRAGNVYAIIDGDCVASTLQVQISQRHIGVGIHIAQAAAGIAAHRCKGGKGSLWQGARSSRCIGICGGQIHIVVIGCNRAILPGSRIPAYVCIRRSADETQACRGRAAVGGDSRSSRLVVTTAVNLAIHFDGIVAGVGIHGFHGHRQPVVRTGIVIEIVLSRYGDIGHTAADDATQPHIHRRSETHLRRIAGS